MFTGTDIRGKIALVTGVGEGIGRSVCMRLAHEGARVIVTARRIESAKDTKNLLGRSDRILAYKMDVTQQKEVESVFKNVQEKMGEPVRLLVNCAGVFENVSLLDMTPSQLDKVIDVNLKGTINVTQAFIKPLVEEAKRGENSHVLKERRGAIVNISSFIGKSGKAEASHCAATKAGIIALTKSWAAELAKYDIRVNCVLPGMIETPMVEHVSKDLQDLYVKTNPLGRLGSTEEVAEVVIFLLSGSSSYMLGACVDVTGGTGM